MAPLEDQQVVTQCWGAWLLAFRDQRAPPGGWSSQVLPFAGTFLPQV